MNSIKYSSIVEAVVDIKPEYDFQSPILAGSKGRVWKVKRNGMLHISFDGKYGNQTVLTPINTVKPVDSPKNTVKVGDLFYSSWGYEQTNISFYQVTGVGKATVKVREIDGKVVTTGMMEGESSPVKNGFNNSVERTHRLNYDGEGKPSFRVNSFSTARPADWNEKHYCSWCH